MKSTVGKILIILIVYLLIFTGCQSKPDFEAMRKEILDIHNQFIRAHWNKDIGFFTKDISEDHLSVGNGEISHPTKEETTARFTDYLNNTTFSEYRNLQEPIIGFSKDGSMAWIIVQMQVAGRRTMPDGIVKEFDNTWAWITLFEREGDRWLRLCEVSNYK